MSKKKTKPSEPEGITKKELRESFIHYLEKVREAGLKFIHNDLIGDGPADHTLKTILSMEMKIDFAAIPDQDEEDNTSPYKKVATFH